MEPVKAKKIEDALLEILPEDIEYKIVKHQIKKGDFIKRHYHPKATEWLLINNGKFEIRLDDEREVFEPKGEVFVFKFVVAQKHSFTALSDVNYYVIRDIDDKTIFSNSIF